MNEECLICGAELVYLERSELMKCEVCGQEYPGKSRCKAGHYVCDNCHKSGLDAVIAVCMSSSSNDPVEILDAMMSLPFCHMHGPEHHIMTGAALLTAYSNSGGDVDLRSALGEIFDRGAEIPGGTCGYWGACGAGLSAGIFVSVITHSDPLSVEGFRQSHLMTAKALDAIGRIGGPRCCKRDSYTSIVAAIDFVREEFGIDMKKSRLP